MRTSTRKLKSAVESPAEQVFWIWRCSSSRTSFHCALSPDSSPVLCYSSNHFYEKSAVKGRARDDGMEWREETLSPFRFPPSRRPSSFPWSRFSFRSPRAIQTKTTRDESGLCLFQAPVQIVMWREKRAVSCHRSLQSSRASYVCLASFPDVLLSESLARL